jgi:putative transposase
MGRAVWLILHLKTHRPSRYPAFRNPGVRAKHWETELDYKIKFTPNASPVHGKSFARTSIPRGSGESKLKYNPQKHHRRSIRLDGYDYTTPGAYFITLVTWQHEYLFGEINLEEMKLNLVGQCAAVILQNLPAHFPIKLDAWMIMPNHLHAILVMEESGDQYRPPIEQPVNQPASLRMDRSLPQGTVSRSLGAIVQNFKSISTRRINVLHNTPGLPLWQRNYYEHIIRQDHEWERIRKYIQNNPAQWAEDELQLKTSEITVLKK